MSNLFTAPPAAGSVGWRDPTPVAMLALEPADAPEAGAYARWLAEELRHEEWLHAGGVFARR